MADPIRIRAKRINDGVTEVVVLMPHPMETGLGLDPSGRGRDAHYISDVEVSLGDRAVLRARLSIAVSKDPLISFRFRGGAAGDRVNVTWTDNLGDQGAGSALIV
ncbi:thiosulfate oxidation carrier complex protein SoxZ [Thiocapsa bogorovii]|uniref:thiosulfate oxidation carrier complex protein SoxZ n=1 Tax=Thiocapsa bogorovii TaxID=521689 RepID=UPI0022B68B30|nr:thiosulfate oxidation carrier complex protein SoxZ [Thiocapsa bogorovii]